jgi:hypothetical protein
MNYDIIAIKEKSQVLLGYDGIKQQDGGALGSWRTLFLVVRVVLFLTQNMMRIMGCFLVVGYSLLAFIGELSVLLHKTPVCQAVFPVT